MGHVGSFLDGDTLYPASGALSTFLLSGFIPSKCVPLSLTFYNANLINADLSGANLVDINLRHTNLSGAVLTNVYLSDAKLFGANLRSANLSYARGWTNEQLAQAESLLGITLVGGTYHQSMAARLLVTGDSKSLAADKSYDSADFRWELRRRGIQPSIP